MKIWKYFVLVGVSSVVTEVHAGPCPAAEQYILRDNGSVTITNRAAYNAAREQCAQDAARAQFNSRINSGAAAPQGGGSVTRMAQGCESVTTPEGVLNICDLTAGGSAGNSTVYILNGAEYNGRVRKNRDGTYTLTPNGALESESLRRGVYSGPPLPSEFNCQNNGDELQCLVCSCFFEARGQSFPERVRIGRTKFSRVMNHNFENNVCGVVHEVMGGGAAAYSWTSTTSPDRFTTSSGAQKRPVNVILGEGSPDLTTTHKNSFRGCVQATVESLQYRDQYFASYYWHKNLEGSPGWISTCMSDTENVSGNLISGVRGESGQKYEFAHNFRRICEVGARKEVAHRDERYLLDPSYLPARSQSAPSGTSRALE